MLPWRRSLPLLGVAWILGASISTAQAQKAEPPSSLPALAVAGQPKNDAPVLQPPRKLPDPAVIPLELVEFRELPLLEAMRLLSQQSGVKIVTSEEANKKKVSLYLKNVSPLESIMNMAQAHGLIHRRDPESGIIRIFTPKENQRDLNDFREDQ